MAESALPAQPMESPTAQDQTGPETGAGCTVQQYRNRHRLYSTIVQKQVLAIQYYSIESDTVCTVYKNHYTVRYLLYSVQYKSTETGAGCTVQQ